MQSKKYDKLVAVSITLDSYLEVIEFDASSKTVLKYENTIVNYNKNERRIDDLDALEDTLREVFLHLDIAQGSPVIISLPDIYISQRIYSARMSGIALETEIKQDLIATKLFDDVNPVARWKQLSVDEDEDTQLVLYSGMKEDIINFLKRAISNLGMDLIAVDNNSFSLIKGVMESGYITEEELEGFDSWAILSLTQDQYQMISLTGKTIMSIAKESLSYEGTVGVYNKISDVILPAIESLWMSNLVIVNTVPGISSKELANRLALDCQVNCIDVNENATDPIYKYQQDNIDSDKALSISPYVFGCGVYQDYPEFGFDFAFDNMKLNISSGGIFDLLSAFNGRKARKSIMSISVLACSILAVISILIFSAYAIQSHAKNKLLAQKDDLTMQMASINPKGTGTVDLKQRAAQFGEKEKNLAKSAALISETIPDNLWIKELYVYPNMSVYIRGYSYNVSDIIEFYKALKTFSKFNDLKISQILMAGEGKDSTNSGTAEGAAPTDGSTQPVNTTTKADSSLPPPPASGVPDPSAMPSLPGVNDTGAGTVAQPEDPLDIPNEPCYEFIIGNKQ